MKTPVWFAAVAWSAVALGLMAVAWYALDTRAWWLFAVVVPLAVAALVVWYLSRDKFPIDQAKKEQDLPPKSEPKNGPPTGPRVPR